MLPAEGATSSVAGVAVVIGDEFTPRIREATKRVGAAVNQFRFTT